MIQRPPISPLFPYTTLFRSQCLPQAWDRLARRAPAGAGRRGLMRLRRKADDEAVRLVRSEEHTSELQSLTNLVCRLLLEKKKKRKETRRETDSIGTSKAQKR